MAWLWATARREVERTVGAASFTLEPHKPLTDEDRKNADIYNSYPSWGDGWFTFDSMYVTGTTDEYYADFTHAKEACADGRYYETCIYWMEPMTVVEALRISSEFGELQIWQMTSEKRFITSILCSAIDLNRFRAIWT